MIANSDHRDTRTRILQSKFSPGDINSAITTAQVFVRIVTSCWPSMVAWQCVFLLMEKGDIDLGQLNSLVSWKSFRPAMLMEWTYTLTRIFSPEAPINQHRNRSRCCNTYGIYVALVLLLMWPASFSAPLLTSSVDWLPHTDKELDHDAVGLPDPGNRTYE